MTESPVSRIRTPGEIARELMEKIQRDNGCINRSFPEAVYPQKHLNAITAVIYSMLEPGEITPELIDLLTTGEAAEVEERCQGHPGLTELNTALTNYFNDL